MPGFLSHYSITPSWKPCHYGDAIRSKPGLSQCQCHTLEPSQIWAEKKLFSVEIAASGTSLYGQKAGCHVQPPWGPVLPSPPPFSFSGTATLNSVQIKDWVEEWDFLTLLNHFASMKHIRDIQWAYIWHPSKSEKKMHLKCLELNIWGTHAIQRLDKTGQIQCSSISLGILQTHIVILRVCRFSITGAETTRRKPSNFWYSFLKAD